jgi:hypothetical protein
MQHRFSFHDLERQFIAMLFAFVFIALLCSAFAAEAPRQLHDDFENAQLASFWLPGNYGSGLYAPGAVKISTNYARSGSQSLEVTVRKGDVASPGSEDTMTERADLDSGHFPLLGTEAFYSFSVLFPKDFPIVDARLVFGTCKQSDVARPILAQRFRNGRHTFTVESQGKRKDFTLPKLALGKWHDIKYHVRYETNSTGLIEAWFDGRRVVRYFGSTAEPGFKNSFYHKFGLYRDQLDLPMTAYFDNFSMRIAVK